MRQMGVIPGVAAGDANQPDPVAPQSEGPYSERMQQLGVGSGASTGT